MSDKARIIAADLTAGDLIVHFADGESVLFHADYLSQARREDNNQLLLKELNDEDEQETEATSP